MVSDSPVLIIGEPFEAARLALVATIERQTLAAVCGADVTADAVTIHKPQSCGKSDAIAWRDLIGPPELFIPSAHVLIPRGNRQERRRARALARRR